MVSSEGQSPGLQGKREYEVSPSDPRHSHAQERRYRSENEQKSSVLLEKTIWISKVS